MQHLCIRYVVGNQQKHERVECCQMQVLVILLLVMVLVMVPAMVLVLEQLPVLVMVLVLELLPVLAKGLVELGLVPIQLNCFQFYQLYLEPNKLLLSLLKQLSLLTCPGSGGGGTMTLTDSCLSTVMIQSSTVLFLSMRLQV